jgi:hypothetical protein
MNRLISYFLCQNNNFTSAKLRPKFRNNYESWLETVNKNDLIIRQTAKSLYKYGLLSKSGRFLVITADSQNRTDFVKNLTDQLGTMVYTSVLTNQFVANLQPI